MSDAAVVAVPRAWLSRAHAGSRVVSASVLLVAAVSPFERPLPGLAGGLTFTTVEVAVVAALAAWLVGLARDRRLPEWRSPIAAPAAAVLLAVLVAALLAPEFGGNAIKFFGRLAAAALVVLLAQNTITSIRVAGHVIAALMAAGAVVGAIAVLELAQVGAVLDALKAFRPGFHVVGGQIRATSTLPYPTIASMYLEVVFALGLFWLVGTHARALAFAALTLVAAGIVATFTRSGLITMALSILVAGGVSFLRHRRWDSGHSALAAIAVVIAALVLLSRTPQLLVARMSAEGSQDWYGAAYDVPETLTMAPGMIQSVPVTVANRGLLTWRSDQLPEFAVSYHWLSADSDEVVIYDGARTKFERAVAPGESVSMPATVRAPGYPGTYVLVWDVVHETRTWLSTEGVLPARTLVTVAGDATSAPLIGRGRMPTGAVRLPRLTLWNTAVAITRDHPVIGIGPDNFRLVYGRRLGLTTWDTRVHSNNTYIEALVGAGIVGFAAVAWLVAGVFLGILKRWPTIADERLPLFAAAAAACVAIAVHGLVDSFITFTPTYVIFALTLGLMFSPAICRDKPLGLSVSNDTPEGVSPQTDGDAHRV
jgi:hypothetical protein